MSAILSPCNSYRYRLERCLAQTDAERRDAKRVLWVMVNPSTADAEKDDATIRKVLGFSRRLGYLEVSVGNLFAFRATDVRELRTALDPLGPNNMGYLQDLLAEADLVIAAWGPRAKFPPRFPGQWRHFKKLADRVGHRLHCLGVAKDGHPRHPLMLPYSSELTPWQVPA